MGRADWGREPTAREHEVRELLAAGERDGLSVRAMAERAGMPPGTLSWWRGDLRRRERLRRAPAVTSQSLPAPPPSRAASFVEVMVSPCVDAATARAGGAAAESDAEPFELELRGGRRVRVPVAFGLARLVRELEGC